MATSLSFGSRSFTRLPSIKISPELASSNPAIIRIVVVLPQPDGPSRTRNSLSEIVKLKSSTAVNCPHCLWTFFSSIDAIFFYVSTLQNAFCIPMQKC